MTRYNPKGSLSPDDLYTFIDFINDQIERNQAYPLYVEFLEGLKIRAQNTIELMKKYKQDKERLR